MRCKCMKKFEKENGFSVNINRSMTVRTAGGFSKRFPINDGFCPLCGRPVVSEQQSRTKKGV